MNAFIIYSAGLWQVSQLDYFSDIKLNACPSYTWNFRCYFWKNKSKYGNTGCFSCYTNLFVWGFKAIKQTHVMRMYPVSVCHITRCYGVSPRAKTAPELKCAPQRSTRSRLYPFNSVNTTGNGNAMFYQQRAASFRAPFSKGLNNALLMQNSLPTPRVPWDELLGRFNAIQNNKISHQVWRTSPPTKPDHVNPYSKRRTSQTLNHMHQRVLRRFCQHVFLLSRCNWQKWP